MVEELKARKNMIESETGRKSKGGLTCFSELAAHELRLLRMSGEKIIAEIGNELKLKNIPVNKFIINGLEREYVPYEVYKKLFIFIEVLNKKKDQQQIKMEVIKLKGMKKNEITFIY
jgi:hypothetical protein